MSSTKVMINFIIVRHGLTTWNAVGRVQGQINTPLAPEGEEQAERVAEVLKNEDVDIVISSNLDRASHTADAIMRKLVKKDNVKREYDDNLKETNFGDIQAKFYLTVLEMFIA
eukprot:m.24770 g.24770  ORF g.24770 m.24770 type:complete len:113 (+) comp7643_c0_seq1:105-443(+)